MHMYICPVLIYVSTTHSPHLDFQTRPPRARDRFTRYCISRMYQLALHAPETNHGRAGTFLAFLPVLQADK